MCSGSGAGAGAGSAGLQCSLGSGSCHYCGTSTWHDRQRWETLRALLGVPAALLQRKPAVARPFWAAGSIGCQPVHQRPASASRFKHNAYPMNGVTGRSLFNFFSSVCASYLQLPCAHTRTRTTISRPIHQSSERHCMHPFSNLSGPPFYAPPTPPNPVCTITRMAFSGHVTCNSPPPFFAPFIRTGRGL